MGKTFSTFTLLACLMFAGSAFASPFEISPREYGSSVNQALEAVEADLRLRSEACDGRSFVRCRFTSERVAVQVEGQASPPRTATIAIEADLFSEEAGAGPLITVADAVLVLGATMMIFDPNLEPGSRAELLSNLSVTALGTGRSEGEGIDARYSLTFDEAASGLLRIEVAPAGDPTGGDLAGLAAR